jgi:hypothetical protein
MRQRLLKIWKVQVDDVKVKTGQDFGARFAFQEEAERGMDALFLGESTTGEPLVGSVGQSNPVPGMAHVIVDLDGEHHWLDA